MKELFRDQCNKRKKKLTFLEKRFDELQKEMTDPIARSPHFDHFLILTRAMEREKGYITWLEMALKWLEEGSEA
ncbi:hypothetical protein [Polycladomyces subterraneus]|uniref:hypothetical protein n=1 Tax=Polycladomyces subterraneus TaxID=1016997 RepID=UPI003426673F